MSDPLIRRAEAIDSETVDAADGLSKSVLCADHGGTVALRRFTLAPGGRVPKHTNAIEHTQYVLSGAYTVGIEGEEHEVTAGDSLHIPAGAVHWYRNDGDDPGAFICAVPTGDDELTLVE